MTAFLHILTSASVPQQVAVNILDGGVDGGPTGHTTRGHVRVCLRVDILETFPGHTGAELYTNKYIFFQKVTFLSERNSRTLTR